MTCENVVSYEHAKQVENLMNNLKSALEKKYWIMYFKLIPDSGNRDEIINKQMVTRSYTENITNRIDASFYRKDKYSSYLPTESAIDELKNKKPYNLSVNIIYNYRSQDIINFSCKHNWHDNYYDANMSENIFGLSTSNININNLVELFDKCYNYVGEVTLADRRENESHLDNLESIFGPG